MFVRRLLELPSVYRREAAVAAVVVVVVVVGESCADCSYCVFDCIWICCCCVLSTSSSLSFASCRAFELRARACVVFWMIEFVPSFIAAMHSSIFAWWSIMISECTVAIIALYWCSRHRCVVNDWVRALVYCCHALVYFRLMIHHDERVHCCNDCCPLSLCWCCLLWW